MKWGCFALAFLFSVCRRLPFAIMGTAWPFELTRPCFQAFESVLEASFLICNPFDTKVIETAKCRLKNCLCSLRTIFCCLEIICCNFAAIDKVRLVEVFEQFPQILIDLFQTEAISGYGELRSFSCRLVSVFSRKRCYSSAVRPL